MDCVLLQEQPEGPAKTMQYSSRWLNKAEGICQKDQRICRCSIGHPAVEPVSQMIPVCYQEGPWPVLVHLNWTDATGKLEIGSRQLAEVCFKDFHGAVVKH